MIVHKKVQIIPMPCIQDTAGVYKNRVLYKKAQISLEVCVLVVIVVAAGLAMQGYLKRAIQGNWKTNADSFSEEQFSPGQTQETVSALKFVEPKIKADIKSDEIIDQEFDLASQSGILTINNWGTYYNGAEHDDED